MGSLQNLHRGSASTSLAQLSRAAIISSPNSLSSGPGSNPNSSLMGFNSAVGGGRVTPTSGSSSFSPSGFPGGSFGASVSNQPPGMSRQLGILQSNNSMSSSSVLSGRNPLLGGRDRGKIGDPLALDPSEFPSLGSRENSSVPNPALSRSNYVGMVKQPAMEAGEFTMSNEDFPALPGPGPNSASTASNSAGPSSMDDLGATAGLMPPGGQLQPPVGSLGGVPMTSDMLHQSNQGSSSAVELQLASQGQPRVSAQAQASGGPRGGIQTNTSGLVTNIPASMVTDQFGMIGLLTFIRAAETDPNLVSLALGADLTTLGLNLNSEVNLYQTFGGPWADTPCRPQDIDYHVPYEYLTNTTIRDKLAPVKLNRYKDDVLFYMFYTNVGDVLQLAAAAELYNRDWRYHKEDRVWITRAPGMPPSEKTTAYERGTYYFFDVNSWRKVPKEFHLAYDKLEERPSLPTNLSGQGGGNTPTSGGSPAPPMVSGGNSGGSSMGMPQPSNMNSGPLQPPPSGL